MRRLIRNINIPGSREFDLKGHPGSGEFDYAWLGLGNLNRKCEFQSILFWPAPIKRSWLFQNMEPFKGKDIAFVSKWLTEKGLTKLCIVFVGMHE